MLQSIVSTKDPERREARFLEFYREAFPGIAKFISSRGGSLEDARDVFQDAVVAYYEKSVSGFAPEQEEHAYLMGIAKHLWYKKQRTKDKYHLLGEMEPEIKLAEDPGIADKKLFQFLSTAGEKCMELLRSFYYNQLSMKEVASRYGYSSERSATVQKYKCLEKVRDKVKEKSMQYEDFLV